jgi:hypothetical protein
MNVQIRPESDWITKPTDPIHLQWCDALCYALGECHRDDAAAICAAFLESVETGGPVLGDPFGMVAGDARLWAAVAPPHELVAYTLAGLERLPKAHLSNPTRKNCFRAIWRTFTDAERATFIKAATKGGK